jgi:hypothetical protein
MELYLAIGNCRNNLSDHLYGFNDFTFAYVDTVHNLCVTIDSRLKFDLHVDLIVHKAMSRAYLILKSFHSHDH